MRALLLDWLKPMFAGPAPIAEVKREARDAALRDLHSAELMCERAIAERDMLKARVARLKVELDHLSAGSDV